MSDQAVPFGRVQQEHQQQELLQRELLQLRLELGPVQVGHRRVAVLGGQVRAPQQSEARATVTAYLATDIAAVQRWTDRDTKNGWPKQQ